MLQKSQFLKIGTANSKVAQWVAHMTEDHDVAGSNPVFGTGRFNDVELHLQFLTVFGIILTFNHEWSIFLFMNSFT